MKTIAALAFRRSLGEVLDEVARTGEPIAITRANQPIVILVPAAGYESTTARLTVRENRLRRAAERLAEWKERHSARLAGLDPVALVRADRASR
jgi:prevent-host-death family protein